MILFLNFAPLSFGGGAEKWVLSVAESLSSNEETVIISADKSIANIYGKIVLGRKFDSRIKPAGAYELVNIQLGDLLTSTFKKNKIRKLLKAARIIYSKYEINEVLILTLFGDKSVLQKTVFGLHSPFKYKDKDLKLLQKLHNAIYLSDFSKKILSNSKNVHVLNLDQELFLKNTFQLKNMVRIPNYIESMPKPSTNSDKTLNICFIGELSQRKGADQLLKIIQESDRNFIFTIAGDGNLKTEIAKINKENVKYLGFLTHADVQNVLSQSDVLFMPSKAESFSLSLLEALSNGLSVVASPYIKLAEISEYLESARTDSIDEYMSILSKLLEQKKLGKLQKRREMIWKKINSDYSKDKILNRLSTNLLS